MRPMAKDQKWPRTMGGLWSLTVFPLGLYAAAFIIGAFEGGDFREIVREFLPVAIIYGLAIIIFFLALIAQKLDEQ